MKFHYKEIKVHWYLQNTNLSLRRKPFIIKAQEIIDQAANFLTGMSRNCSPELRPEEKTHMGKDPGSKSLVRIVFFSWPWLAFFSYWIKGCLPQPQGDRPHTAPPPPLCLHIAPLGPSISFSLVWHAKAFGILRLDEHIIINSTASPPWIHG